MLRGIEELAANWNGQMMPLSEVKISPLDRGWLFGDAMYEVVRVVYGQPWLGDEHIARLCEGLKSLSIHGIDTTTLKERMLKLIESEQCEHGFIYMHVTRGEALRRHLPFDDMTPNCLLYLQKFADADPLALKRSQGISMITLEDIRWKRTDLKTTNLLGNVLSCMDASRAGVDDGIFINHEGHVTETTHSNIFFVRHGRVITPPCEGILNGVTRTYMMDMFASQGIPVQEELVTHDDIYDMDEIFLTATMAGVMPVVAVDGRSVRSGRPGLMTMSATNWYLKAQDHLRQSSGKKPVNGLCKESNTSRSSWLVSQNPS